MYACKKDPSMLPIIPQSWTVQGTNDETALYELANTPASSRTAAMVKDSRWTTLWSEKNNNSLETPFERKSFPIPKRNQSPFRIFRVIQTGENSSSPNEEWKDAFSVAGFDMYGTIYKKNENYVPPADATEANPQRVSTPKEPGTIDKAKLANVPSVSRAQLEQKKIKVT